MQTTYPCFNAGGLGATQPPVPPHLKWRVESASTNEVLVLKGIYVGVVTKTKSSRLTAHESGKTYDEVVLIRWDPYPARRSEDVESLTESSSSWPEEAQASYENTSWGSCKSAVGDIIVVVSGCRLPISLRKYEENTYLLVGCCWLIDSELEDLTGINRLDENENLVPCRDKGFSPIMFGSLMDGVDEKTELEEFYIV